jgi:hypothetical protein
MASNPVPLAAPDQSRFKAACVPLWVGTTGTNCDEREA